MTTHGGARQKVRQDDRRGGARPGAGALVRRLHLDKETATALRVLTLVRRGITGNQALQPVDVATDLINAAWREYNAGIEENDAVD